MANFSLASSKDCLALLDQVFQAGGLDSGKPLLIRLDLESHRVVGAGF
jgi:hypothetical protein